MPPESPLRQFAARVLPRPVKALIHRALDRPEHQESAEDPLHLSLGWMPAAAYQPFWRGMPAFALPSYYDGRIRLNLAGRESHGTVAVESYRSVLESVEKLLRECVDPATGESAVDFVEYPALQNPLAAGSTQSDLVVVWKGAATCLEHPLLGRIGPVPYRRTGGHTGRYGMAYIRADNRRVGDRGVASAFDLVPTIIDLIGQPRLRSLSGTSLLATA